MAETRYQRIAREQAERQAARKARMTALAKPARKGRAKPGRTEGGPWVDPDGLYRDNLGHSPDY